jgi:hypothetical protein
MFMLWRIMLWINRSGTSCSFALWSGLSVALIGLTQAVSTV